MFLRRLFMVEDLKQLYRVEFVEIFEYLIKEEFKKFLYYCIDYILGSFLSSFLMLEEIFWCLEEKEKILYEKVGFLMKFVDKIGRKDLVIKFNRFELIRELMIFVLNR